MLMVTALSGVHHRSTGFPTSVGNIIVVELRCDSDIAGEQKATESEELLSTHVVGCFRNLSLN
jgi:hypothetical protein